MKIMLRSVQVIDPQSPWNGKSVDVELKNGRVSAIDKKLQLLDGFKEIKAKGQCLSPGWFDLHADFAEPGNEWREDISTGAEAAARGGFTGVALSPLTDPVIDNKAGVEYFTRRSDDTVVELFPKGTLTVGARGEQMAELFDMHRSGAVAFTDDTHAVQNPNLIKLGLLYTRDFNGIVMSFPHEPNICGKGVMNEGENSTYLGLKGMPKMAEEIMVQREIDLAEYTGGRLHLRTITTARSVELIRRAKDRGFNITADVSVAHLLFSDGELREYDTRWKVMPPLREDSDRRALLQGLRDGTIDAVSTDHSPQDIETKKCEFDLASFGMIALQTAYPLLKQNLSDEEIVRYLGVQSRQVIGMEAPVIDIDNEINFTLFDPAAKWTWTENEAASKSKNSPLFGREFSGKVVGVFRGKHSVQF
ncbi:MAG: dihydroorotase [Flavobacteriales bacterium]|nr:dihydroorotase [Flavobacteriales bacterium]